MIGYHVCSGADKKTTSQPSKISKENSVRDKSSTLPRSFFQYGSIQMKMSDYHLLKHGVTAIRSPVFTDFNRQITLATNTSYFKCGA